MRRSLLFLFSVFVFTFPTVSGAAEEGKIGIVLLHGKQDKAPYEISSLTGKLKGAGYLVVTPEMPWSRNRIYDASYEEAMQPVASLKNVTRRVSVLG